MPTKSQGSRHSKNGGYYKAHFNKVELHKIAKEKSRKKHVAKEPTSRAQALMQRRRDNKLCRRGMTSRLSSFGERILLPLSPLAIARIIRRKRRVAAKQTGQTV